MASDYSNTNGRAEPSASRLEHRPRRRFGQNFLHDQGVLQRIVNAINPRPDDAIIEIGPGQGALTVPLLDRVNALEVIEIDRDLLEPLSRLAPSERLCIHAGDALHFDFAARARERGRLRVVGNLPYNITTPLLFYLLAQAAALRDMHFLLQKEVVQRLVAEPGSKAYGRLTVMLRARARATQLFTVGPGAFRPAPKVDSALVRIEPWPEPRVPAALAGRFQRVVAQAFSGRRKTLRRALAGLLGPEHWERTSVASGARAETLDIDAFLALAQLLPPDLETEDSAGLALTAFEAMPIPTPHKGDR